MDKENETQNIADFKRQLYKSFKETGVLDGIKTQLRGKLMEKLNKYSKQPELQSDKKILESDSITEKILCSLVLDFLKTNGYNFSLSVYVPESGLSTNSLTTPEILQLLHLSQDTQV